MFLVYSLVYKLFCILLLLLGHLSPCWLFNSLPTVLGGNWRSRTSLLTGPVWLRTSLSCQLLGAKRLFGGVICMFLLYSLFPDWFWPPMWRWASVLMDSSYFCVVFYCLYWCKADLVQPESFLKELIWELALAWKCCNIQQICDVLQTSFFCLFFFFIKGVIQGK